MNYAKIIYLSQAMSLFDANKSVAEFYGLRDPVMGWYKVNKADDLRGASVMEVIKAGARNVFMLVED